MKSKFASLSNISANKPIPLNDDSDVSGGVDCGYTCPKTCDKSCNQTCTATGNVVSPVGQ